MADKTVKMTALQPFIDATNGREIAAGDEISVTDPARVDRLENGGYAERVGARNATDAVRAADEPKRA